MGTSASLSLRLGHAFFSTASLLFMCLHIDFYNYTAFSYLVTVMGLMIPWSLTLVMVDAYSVFIKYLPHQPRILLVIIAGDWVTQIFPCSVFGFATETCRCSLYASKVHNLGNMQVLSFLSLAAACATASVTDLLVDAGGSFCPTKSCSRFQLSATMAFLSWFLSFASSLFNLWLLPSL
ncbi:unnamed protein product [Linum tenue]|uniref:CASP-like protein n=1 Tax=Linum tenue TaxID=586396 RepID=A0AAV0NJU6_9ROSI|nr:unnamed protein product [Linum tenue]